MNNSVDSVVQNAAAAISSGGVIAYPTSSIWGLGCAPSQEQALLRIFQIKQRPSSKGLILVAGAWAEFADYFPSLTAEQINRIIAPTPHPCTWLVEDKANKVSELVKGDNAKVAIRIDQHPFVKEVCSVLQHPITSTSANPQGEEPATDAAMIRKYFGDAIDYVVDAVDAIDASHDASGSSGSGSSAMGISGRPSIIRDLASGEYIRGL
ncbi:MAG: L-threonylcarbamoyladenylate synthase [Gammaproteobacteria bacterium]|nr:L-threonylcarbamoyladenylate synthase [Gammaproteobacteria bacterium]